MNDHHVRLKFTKPMKYPPNFEEILKADDDLFESPLRGLRRRGRRKVDFKRKKKDFEEEEDEAEYEDLVRWEMTSRSSQHLNFKLHYNDPALISQS